jgi:hypothetical protein
MQFNNVAGTVPNLYGTSWQEFGVFVGIVSVYMCVSGFLVFAAELRFAAIKQHILVHFGFLNSFLGRFFFYSLLGTMLLAVGHVGPRIVGGTLLASGVCQLLISVLVSKDILPYSEADDSFDGIFAATGSSKDRDSIGQREPDTSWASASAGEEKKKKEAAAAGSPAADPKGASGDSSKVSRAARTTRAKSSVRNPLSAAAGGGSASADSEGPSEVPPSCAAAPSLPAKVEPVEPSGGTADNPWG